MNEIIEKIAQTIIGVAVSAVIVAFCLWLVGVLLRAGGYLG